MAKTQVGKLIQPDGSVSTVRPHNGEKFTLEELQGFVGGYIERLIMCHGNGRGTLYCNEDGKSQGLARNAQATQMTLAGAHGDMVVGAVILVETEGK